MTAHETIAAILRASKEEPDQYILPRMMDYLDKHVKAEIIKRTRQNNRKKAKCIICRKPVNQGFSVCHDCGKITF
jgi:hypothetical protein